jgi:hypothetical protein
MTNKETLHLVSDVMLEVIGLLFPQILALYLVMDLKQLVFFCF